MQTLLGHDQVQIQRHKKHCLQENTYFALDVEVDSTTKLK